MVEKKVMKKSKLASKLPKYLHQYFWEIDVEKFNPSDYSFYIAERLMDRGDLKALKWLFKNFSKDYLKEVYLNSRNISRFSRSFWSAYLQIYPLKILCSQKEFLQPPKTAWQY